MNNKLSQLVLSVVLSGGLLLPLEVQAETSVDQEIETGFQVKDVNSPEAKFEEYREVPNGIFLERYELNAQGETTDLTVELRNIRQEDQSATFEMDKGRLSIDASWNQTPHLRSKDSSTPYVETADGYFALPDYSQTANPILIATNTAYTLYPEAMHPIELKTRTDRGAIDLNYNLEGGYKASLGVSETIKKGHQALGASFTRSHVVNIAQPIDQKTYQSNLGFGFAGKNHQWNVGYGFSAFRNDRETLTVENPRLSTDIDSESSLGRLNAAPDNIAHFASLNGGVNLPAKTRFTAEVNMSYMRQNQSLLPFSINTANTPFTQSTDPSILPTDKADAKVVNLDQDYKVTNKAFKPLTMGLRYHSFQQNNKTPEYVFTGSAGLDFNDSTDDQVNHAFEMRKDTLEGSLDFDLLKSVNLGTRYEMAWIDREHREVKKTQEGTMAFDINYKPASWFLARGTYANARRRMEDFHVDDLIDAGETPGMRHYDISDRDRNDGKLLIQMMTKKTTLGIRGSLGHDQYKPGKGDLAALNDGGNAANQNTMYGLLESRRVGTGIDIDTTLNNVFAAFGFFDYQMDKSRQRSNLNSGAVTQDDATNWEIEVQNLYHTAGLGINADVGFTILTFGVDIAQSQGVYDYVSRGSASTVQGPNYPHTKTTKQNYYVQAMVPVKKELELSLGYVFEKYDVYDWASDGATTTNFYGTTSELYLGDASQDYQAHIVTAKVKYKFGNTKE